MSTPTTACRPGFDWQPDAPVPDWVVLGRLRHAALVGAVAPPDLCPREELHAYVPALRATGLSHTAIETATGVNSSRYHHSEEPSC